MLNTYLIFIWYNYNCKEVEQMKKNMTERIFKCPKCNYRQIAYKKSSRLTKVGHLKNLWCPICKDEHNFVQISKWS